MTNRAKATYDPEADAIGIYFRSQGGEYVESEEIMPGITLDFDAEGRVIGVEILDVRELMESRLREGPADENAEKPAAE